MLRLKKLKDLLESENKAKMTLQLELDQVKRDLRDLPKEFDKKQKEIERNRLQSMPVPYSSTMSM